jgi:hypothetical protein
MPYEGILETLEIFERKKEAFERLTFLKGTEQSKYGNFIIKPIWANMKYF